MAEVDESRPPYGDAQTPSFANPRPQNTHTSSLQTCNHPAGQVPKGQKVCAKDPDGFIVRKLRPREGRLWPEVTQQGLQAEPVPMIKSLLILLESR